MRVQIIHNAIDSKVPPTEMRSLEEVKCFRDKVYYDLSTDRSHYHSKWYIEMEASEVGSFLVDLQSYEKDIVSLDTDSNGNNFTIYIGEQGDL